MKKKLDKKPISQRLPTAQQANRLQRCFKGVYKIEKTLTGKPPMSLRQGDVGIKASHGRRGRARGGA